MIIVVRRVRCRDALAEVLDHPAFEEPRPPGRLSRCLARYRSAGRHRRR